jgi:ribonuclease D
MMARERDIVQWGNPHCDEVVERVLGFKLNKLSEVRCSKWSAPRLSKKQQAYAALDIIKPLEAYYKMLEMPDLSQWIDPESCQLGVIVDIVPHTPETIATKQEKASTLETWQQEPQ